MEKIVLNKDELSKKLVDIDDDLSDALIVLDWLKHCEINPTNEMIRVLRNVTLEDDIYVNIDKSIESVNRAFKILEWLKEQIWSEDGKEHKNRLV